MVSFFVGISIAISAVVLVLVIMVIFFIFRNQGEEKPEVKTGGSTTVIKAPEGAKPTEGTNPTKAPVAKEPVAKAPEAKATNPEKQIEVPIEPKVTKETGPVAPDEKTGSGEAAGVPVPVTKSTTSDVDDVDKKWASNTAFGLATLGLYLLPGEEELAKEAVKRQKREEFKRGFDDMSERVRKQRVWDFFNPLGSDVPEFEHYLGTNGTLEPLPQYESYFSDKGINSTWYVPPSQPYTSAFPTLS